MTAVADSDRGVATVWAAVAIAALVSTAVFGLHLGEALVARHHAESAADLAALAGAAGVLPGEQHACAQARRVTDRMRVELVSCRVQGLDVLVDVAAQPPGWLGELGAATAQARAGPLPPARGAPSCPACRAHVPAVVLAINRATTGARWSKRCSTTASDSTGRHRPAGHITGLHRRSNSAHQDRPENGPRPYCEYYNSE